MTWREWTSTEAGMKTVKEWVLPWRDNFLPSRCSWLGGPNLLVEDPPCSLPPCQCHCQRPHHCHCPATAEVGASTTVALSPTKDNGGTLSYNPLHWQPQGSLSSPPSLIRHHWWRTMVRRLQQHPQLQSTHWPNCQGSPTKLTLTSNLVVRGEKRAGSLSAFWGTSCQVGNFLALCANRGGGNAGFLPALVWHFTEVRLAMYVSLGASAVYWNWCQIFYAPYSLLLIILLPQNNKWT